MLRFTLASTLDCARRAALRLRAALCDALAAVPCETAKAREDYLNASLADKAQVLEAHARLRDEAQRVETHRDKLAADLCGAEEARDEAEAERDRALDQLLRLEATLTAEQGLRASAERAAMRESTLREEVADLAKTRTEQRECLLRLRADLSTLDQAARDVSAAAVAVELLDTAFLSAITKLRDVLAARAKNAS